MLFHLADVATDTPSVGGKARGLARAREAGLAVPDGVVLTEADDDPSAALSLGTRLVVRSSAEIEDGPGQAAPGVFASRRDVDADGLVAAIRAVRASGAGETAQAYARARRLAFPFSMAVIVQRQVSGPRGTAYSRTFGGEEVLVESGDDAALVGAGRILGGVRGLDATALAGIAAAARIAELVLDRPADIEWVLADRLWIVQLRPIIAATAPETPPSFARELAKLDTAATWTWDADHNPEPLSPAQRGLVALVDEARAAPIRQQVIAGYLYCAPGGAVAAPVEAPEIPPLFNRLEAALATMNGDLETVLGGYLSFYRLYATVLGPSLARLPREQGALRLPHPDLAPAWDVASPTFAETPGLLARLAATDAPTPLRELDDMYFARAQAAVRRALRARARVLAIGEDDVFWLPLADVRAGRVADAAPRAAAARAAQGKLRAFVPPRAIVQGAPIFSPPPDADVLRGRGTGGRARGKVVRIDPQRPAPAPHGIVVVPTLTPPLALLCRDAAALVSEHGGLLGHAAALARELGIPCVVGCLGADRLQEGDEVWVDADAGLVLRI